MPGYPKWPTSWRYPQLKFCVHISYLQSVRILNFTNFKSARWSNKSRWYDHDSNWLNRRSRNIQRLLLISYSERNHTATLTYGLSSVTSWKPSICCHWKRRIFLTFMKLSYEATCSQFSAVHMLNISLQNRKAVLLQTWSGPECSRKLRFPDFIIAAQDGGKVVSLTHRPPLPPGNAPGTHFC